MKVIQYLDNLSKTQLKLLPNVKSDLEMISFKRWNNILHILKDNNPKPLEDVQFIYHNEIDGIKYQNILECIPMGDRYKFYHTPIGMTKASRDKMMKLSISINVTFAKTVFVKDLELAEKLDEDVPLPAKVLTTPTTPSDIKSEVKDVSVVDPEPGMKFISCEKGPVDPDVVAKKKRRRKRKRKASKDA